MTESRMLHAKKACYRISLEHHLAETQEAALRLFGERTRWGKSWCRFF